MSTFTENLKSNAAAITALFTTFTTVGAIIVYFESTYANNNDLQDVINIQKTFEKSSKDFKDSLENLQGQLYLFQVEYIDEKIHRLQEDKRILEEHHTSQIEHKVIDKTPQQIDEEVKKLEDRKNLILKLLAIHY